MENISVILSTYNRKNTLRRALNSVCVQTLPADEIIVVDDGSEDGTESMVATEFPTVNYIYQANAGVSTARNSAIQASSGDWLAILDSDDEWLPEKLKHQITLIQQHPNYKICHTEEIWVRNGRRVNAMKKHAKQGGWIFQHCLPLCAMSPSSIMIHRSVFNSTGLFDVTLPACEDYDLWLRITARFPVLFIEQPLIIKYGGHDDQLSKKYWGMDRFRIQALEKIITDPILNAEDRLAAINMLLKKLEIYKSGAEKRNKQNEVEQLQQRIHIYRSQVESWAKS